MKQNFPTSGLIQVAIPAHVCHPMALQCYRGYVHIVKLGKQETMCNGRDCQNWKHFDLNLFELKKERCLDHLVCKKCQRLLVYYIVAAYAPHAVNWNNPSNPTAFPVKKG